MKSLCILCAATLTVVACDSSPVAPSQSVGLSSPGQVSARLGPPRIDAIPDTTCYEVPEGTTVVIDLITRDSGTSPDSVVEKWEYVGEGSGCSPTFNPPRVTTEIVRFSSPNSQSPDIATIIAPACGYRKQADIYHFREDNGTKTLVLGVVVSGSCAEPEPVYVPPYVPPVPPEEPPIINPICTNCEPDPCVVTPDVCRPYEPPVPPVDEPPVDVPPVEEPPVEAPPINQPCDVVQYPDCVNPWNPHH